MCRKFYVCHDFIIRVGYKKYSQHLTEIVSELNIKLMHSIIKKYSVESFMCDMILLSEEIVIKS